MKEQGRDQAQIGQQGGKGVAGKNEAEQRETEEGREVEQDKAAGGSGEWGQSESGGTLSHGVVILCFWPGGEGGPH